MSKFFILRTEDRKGAKDDYIICVNPSIKKASTWADSQCLFTSGRLTKD